MKMTVAMFATALAFVLQGAFLTAHADETASGHCTGMTVTDFLSSSHNNRAFTATWKAITDAHLNFTTSSTGCVVVTFSGVAALSSTNIIHVRTLLDGNNLCVPALTNDFFFSGSGSDGSAHSITRVCKNVSAGAHTVQVQYRGESKFLPIEMLGHVLTVTHN